jgi:hypothetical protein
MASQRRELLLAETGERAVVREGNCHAVEGAAVRRWVPASGFYAARGQHPEVQDRRCSAAAPMAAVTAGTAGAQRAHSLSGQRSHARRWMGLSTVDDARCEG